MSRRLAVALVCAALLLGACGKKGTPRAGSGESVIAALDQDAAHRAA